MLLIHILSFLILGIRDNFLILAYNVAKTVDQQREKDSNVKIFHDGKKKNSMFFFSLHDMKWYTDITFFHNFCFIHFTLNIELQLCWKFELDKISYLSWLLPHGDARFDFWCWLKLFIQSYIPFFLLTSILLFFLKEIL